jgi:NAD(P)-dependent dehydrogenase (short-subunit alcohol dehydrogenase family)
MSITLITGTSSGIGKATALHLAGRGHKVYASMQTLDQGQELVADANDRRVSVELLALDVDDDESVQAAVANVLQREGRIDVCINNAGIAFLGAIERSDSAIIRQMFETNFFGALRVTRAVLPTMRKQRSGTIVNISSAASHVALPCLGMYSATKSALETVSESLAGEVYHFGIRVVLIEPGFVVTPILRRGLESFQLDEHSPYYDSERHTYAIFAQGEQTGSHPSVVAEAIEAAINDPERRFRYRVTPDAEVLIDGRARMADEEWVAMGRHASDEEYFGEFAARFPMGKR